MKSVWMKFCSALRSFRVARAGNVAITFAFASLPIIVGVGFAVDYSRASQVKVAIQAALDSTALMISKEAARDTSSQLQTNAQNYFNALFIRGSPRVLPSLSSYYDPKAERRWLSTAQPTSYRFLNFNFLGYIGIPNMTVSSSSTVKWGSIAPARGAGARQHRLDGRQRQDHRIEDGDRQLAHPAQERRHHQWRRLCLDHSLREGRQSRPLRVEFGLDLLGHRGAGSDAIRQ